MRDGKARMGVLCVCAMLVLGLSPEWATAQTDGDPLVVVVVRHAEKADDDPRDPSLAGSGVERADGLARMLADVPLRGVWSSDYRRTRDTAAPVAVAHGLEVRLYDPSGDHGPLVSALAAEGGHHLVVGHSNTVPTLVRALGGDPGAEIPESEYDRLYVVQRTPDGSVSTTLLRFGVAAGAR